ncbi:HAD-IIIA family hydrolase [Kineococcus xinjiangensis]|uniref:HAD-IIIA family hydrolase n=1 Tax=Kineococcus xinjiangensis TaxID=512762 RepID=UPI003183C846
MVVPTVGRPGLARLLTTLVGQEGPAPVQVVVVDDRPTDPGTRDGASLSGRRADPAQDPCERACAQAREAGLDVLLVRSGGRGAAAARNAGWRRARTEWIVFVDDDVELPAGWARALAADLADCPADVGGVQGRLVVPLPQGRRPTDWERGTAGLETAAWITADMAYRREALVDVGGFDERFPRAFREDSDLALRVQDAGWRLVRGEHTSVRPVRPADDLASARQQRGNADDVLMGALHGPRWRQRAEAAVGRLPWHAVTVAAGAGTLAAAATGRRRVAAVAAAGWLGLTADFAWRRIAPGPRSGDEVRRMLLTSALIPPLAVWHRLRGELAWRGPGRPASWPPPVRAVLFDRDGTLVHDVPCNGDPDLVRPVDGAAEALARVRAAGLATAIVSNQPGVGRGLLTTAQVDAVNARVEELLGPFDAVVYCPDGPDAPSPYRKPEPGMVLEAARRLGVTPAECLLIGDIGADVEAALAAGARAVLVPTPLTRPEEVEATAAVVGSLPEAVDLALAVAPPARQSGGRR